VAGSGCEWPGSAWAEEREKWTGVGGEPERPEGGDLVGREENLMGNDWMGFKARSLTRKFLISVS